MMKNKILLLSILGLSACTPTYEDLSEWVTKTRQDAKSRVIPFEEPVVTPPKSYTPPPSNGLNAFDNRRLNNMRRGSNAPDLNRPKETLEAFSLESLKYVGSLRSGNKVSGFIEAEGHTYTVHAGNYIGQNYGRIQRIDDNEIVLSELVEDSYGNWIYRTAKLPLSGTSSDGNTPSNPSEQTESEQNN